MSQEPQGKQAPLPRQWVVFLTQNLGGNLKYQSKHGNATEDNTKFTLIFT